MNYYIVHIQEINDFHNKNFENKGMVYICRAKNKGT